MLYRLLDTPTGPFAVCADADGRLATLWVDGPDDPRLDGGSPDDALRPDLVRRLDAFFAGEAVDFSDVPTPEGPPFFERCWAACRAIPRGETRTYAELAGLAASTGPDPGSARAAGQAMRRNPLPVIVPCHRVLPAGRGLGGFGGSTDPAGESIRTKRWLLTMEQAIEPGLFEDEETSLRAVGKDHP